MVCKENICHAFRCLKTYERLDLLCKLLHLCTPHELRFLAAVVEDKARKDYTCLKDSANKANSPVEVKKLHPSLFKPTDRSTMIVYLSLLSSTNTASSHALFNMLTRIEAQRLDYLQQRHATMVAQGTDDVDSAIDSDLADDVILLYTMAAYHPAFTISQRLQLSDYLQKAEAYLKEYLSQNEDGTSSPSGCSGCEGSKEKTIRKPVRVRDTELKATKCDRSNHSHTFRIQVTWSDGEVTEIERTYHQLQAFHAELIRLFPKDSGAHRQERHIPYLPQEKRGSYSPSTTEFEEHISKYIKHLSRLPDHMMQCDHMTKFFTPDKLDGNRPAGHNPAVHNNDNQTTVHSQSNPEERVSVHSGLAIPTAHALTTMVQQKYSYSSVVASPLTHHSPLPSALSSPHVSPSHPGSTPRLSPSQPESSPSSPSHVRNNPHYSSGCYSVQLAPCQVQDNLSQSPLSHSTMCTPPPHHHQNIQTPPPQSQPAMPSPNSSDVLPSTGKESIGQWLKNLRLHKYAGHLNKYTWQELTQLSDDALEKEGLTDGAKRKFKKELELQLKKMADLKNGVVSPFRPAPHSQELSQSASNIRTATRLTSASSPVQGQGHRNSANPSHPGLPVSPVPCPSHTPSLQRTNTNLTPSLGNNQLPFYSPTITTMSGPPGVHVPLRVMTHAHVMYPPGLAGSIGSSIGSSSPALSDCSGLSPPSSPRSLGTPVFLEQHPLGGQNNNIKSVGPGSPKTPTVSSENYKPTDNMVASGVDDPPTPTGDVGPSSGLVILSYPSTPNGPIKPGPMSEAMVPQQVPLMMPIPHVADRPDGNLTSTSPLPVPQPIGIRPRIPLNTHLIRSPIVKGNNNHYMKPLMPTPRYPLSSPLVMPTNGATNGGDSPGLVMAQTGNPCASPDVIATDSTVPVIGYSHPLSPAMIPRVPSLLGPNPGCQILPRPSTLGVHVPSTLTSNIVTYSMAHLPGQGTTSAMFDNKGAPLHLPPTNIPPPMTSTPVDTGPFGLFPTESNCTVTYTSINTVISTAPGPTPAGPLVHGSGILPTPNQPPPPNGPPPHVVPVAAASPSPVPITHPPPGHTPTTVPTPVPQISNPGCTCHCNCQQCSGQPQPLPIHHPLPFQQMGWPHGSLFPPGYPMHGGLRPVSSNGLVSPSLPFPVFTHQHSSQYNMTPELMYEARNFYLQQVANQQGVPPQFPPNMHYPVMPGLPVSIAQAAGDSKPPKNRNIMCYNCGGAGHIAYDCKAATVDAIARSAHFHLNIQPKTEAD